MDPETCTDPLLLLEHWLADATRSGERLADAMTLATVDDRGKPRARMVLCKGIVAGGVHFYTCYDSSKARELAHCRCVALVFHWAGMQRQVRLEGVASRLPDSESDRYFATRPRESQLSAWASPQSQRIESRDWLDLQYAEVQKRFFGKAVPRPPNWGGYAVRPERVEFWQGQPGRLHDRWLFSEAGGRWERVRLAP